MHVSFFIPREYLPDETRREAWKSGGQISLLGGGKAATAQSWIYQTWVELRRRDADVSLAHELPETGVVVALAGNLPPSLRPVAQRFLVDVAADGLPHPAAQCHVVQNRAHAQRLPGARFIPHWPQPGLIPRLESRGDCFETLRFYGDAPNLAPGLGGDFFAQKVHSTCGLHFECVPPSQWHNYSDTDCALGVRELSQKSFLTKPATKLTNAWLAGVPFVGGWDSAYLSEGTPGTNYFRCQTVEEILHALLHLQQNPQVRKAMVSQGRRAAEPFSSSSIARSWESLFQAISEKHFPRWISLPESVRKIIFLSQRIVLAWDRALLR